MVLDLLLIGLLLVSALISALALGSGPARPTRPRRHTGDGRGPTVYS